MQQQAAANLSLVRWRLGRFTSRWWQCVCGCFLFVLQRTCVQFIVAVRDTQPTQLRAVGSALLSIGGCGHLGRCIAATEAVAFATRLVWRPQRPIERRHAHAPAEMPAECRPRTSSQLYTQCWRVSLVRHASDRLQNGYHTTRLHSMAIVCRQ